MAHPSPPFTVLESSSPMMRSSRAPRHFRIGDNQGRGIGKPHGEVAPRSMPAGCRRSPSRTSCAAPRSRDRPLPRSARPCRGLRRRQKEQRFDALVPDQRRGQLDDALHDVDEARRRAAPPPSQDRDCASRHRSRPRRLSPPPAPASRRARPSKSSCQRPLTRCHDDDLPIDLSESVSFQRCIDQRRFNPWPKTFG